MRGKLQLGRHVRRYVLLLHGGGFVLGWATLSRKTSVWCTATYGNLPTRRCHLPDLNTQTVLLRDRQGEHHCVLCAETGGAKEEPEADSNPGRHALALFTGTCRIYAHQLAM